MALHHSPLFRAAPLLAAISLPLTGCGIGHQMFGGGDSANASLGQTQAAPSVFGYAVADEPQAAVVARQILSAGGNAADAAAAAGFALAVTLPSRAGLGGGGACIIKMPDAQGNAQPPVTLLFPAAPNSATGDRPAAAPTMARGLLALQARYGTLPYASVIVPAERLAGGVPVSPALAADLQVVGNALLADPAARAVFAAPGGGVLQAGANMAEPDLATTLEILRTQDVEGLYKGSFGAQFVAAADQAGGGLTASDLDAALPHFGVPDIGKINGVTVASIPTAAASGTLPASAGFAVLDKNGGAVACATSMNNLFGTGRIAPGTGILLAASPRAVPAPLLAAGLAYVGGQFRAAVTGTGQQGAAMAVQAGLAKALTTMVTVEVPEPGRANIIACPGGVPGGEASCTASADPRGQGLAVGGR